MREVDAINAFRTHLGKWDAQRNGPFESDAEIIDLDGRLLAVTADEFSDEDMMGSLSGDPELLGWNVVTATLSDLLAVGAEPRFMLQSVVLPPSADAAMLSRFSAGLHDAADAFGCAIVGGDVGAADDWRYTGFAVGTFASSREPITRKTTLTDGVIVATGDFGDANLAAASGGPSTRFECRLRESRLLADGPAACIDTSDGLVRALETLAEQNDLVRLVLDIDSAPYAAGVDGSARAAGIRPEALLLASAGEYELVAMVSSEFAAALIADGAFTAIGSFGIQHPVGVHYRRCDGEMAKHEACPDPRAMSGIAEYRAAVIELAERLFGGSEGMGQHAS